MNRVWKKFLIKIGKVVAALCYVLSVMIIPGFIAQYFGYDPGIGIVLGAVTFMLLPMCVIIVRDLYKEAKYEVEKENKDLLRTIGGNRY